MTETCDKNRRPIRVGDILKVYHFTGARRKKHFMYKQVIGIKTLGGHGDTPKSQYFVVSHLNLLDDGIYHLRLNSGMLKDYEIVQGANDIHEDRAKVEIPEAA